MLPVIHFSHSAYPAGYVTVSSPLGGVRLLGTLPVVGHVSVESAIAGGRMIAAQSVAVLVGASPLADPSVLADVPICASLLLASPLVSGSTQALLGISDFSAGLPASTVNSYVCDITGGEVDLRVPISTWQATLQLDRKEYLQVTVPAAAAYADELTARSAAGGEIVISRVAILQGGGSIEYEMARGPLQTVRLDYGAERYSASLSGYGDATVPVADPAAYARTIPDRAIRSVSITGGSVRVRCSIDWLLRPGYQVTAAGNTWTCDYINYYVGADPAQAYMDAGTRGTA